MEEKIKKKLKSFLVPVAVYEKVEKVRKELGLRTLGSTILFLAEDYLFKNKLNDKE